MVEAAPQPSGLPEPARSEAGRAVWCISIQHPGAIVRDQWAREPQQWEYLRRARGLAGGTWEPPSHDALLAHSTLDPSLPQLQAWEAQLRQGSDQTLTVDIECAGPHLVAVGLCRVRDLSAVVVRFRGPGGTQHWGAELPAVVQWLWELLADPAVPKWFHNGQAFDIPYLHYQGFEVQGYVGDTLLLQRYMFPEMGAGLQECAVFYCGWPAWKQLADQTNDDEKGEGK